jgi:hypothetical protein
MFKHLKVREETHDKIKKQAKGLGLTVMDFLDQMTSHPGVIDWNEVKTEVPHKTYFKNNGKSRKTKRV